jgi:hypothetical protein
VTLGIVGPNGELLPKKKAGQADEDVFVPEAPPANWRDLPTCFAEAWKHAEKIRELRHAVTVAKKAAEAVKVSDMDSENEEHRAAKARLRAAYDALHGYNPEAAQRAQIACGVATSIELSEANLLRDRLERLAFETFSARVAALELHPSKVRHLFAGSALHTRFVQPPLTLGRMRVASGTTHYCDANLTTLAEYLAEAARLRELIADAQAEHDAAAQALSSAGGRTLQIGRRKAAA